MTVIEDFEDRNGKNPLVFKGYKNLEEVHRWLFDHYWGYHFSIMMNCMGDEYEPLGKELYVYFSDEALDEICAYTGYEVIKNGRT